jgi:hypothetical protein
MSFSVEFSITTGGDRRVVTVKGPLSRDSNQKHRYLVSLIGKHSGEPQAKI